jgi:DedD protein
MDENTFKHRIVGVIVLVTMGVIFIPMLLSGHRDDVFQDENVIPAKPAVLENLKVYELENPIPEPGLREIKRAPVDALTVKNDKDNKPKVRDKPASKPEKTYPVAKAATNKPPLKSQPEIKGWVVQAGSFSKRANAIRLRDKLRKNGYPAFVEKITSKNMNIYRVRIGPEVRKVKAEKIQAEIKTKLKLKSIVVAHP